jgi:hypothetical protein
MEAGGSFKMLERLTAYILLYIQQDATLNSLFYLETALHVSGGTTTHHQEHKQLYLQHLMVGGGTTRNM